MPDITQIRELPKVSLHDHLDGGVRPSTVLELRRDARLPTPTDDPEELHDLILTRSRSGSLTSYLSSFALVTEALQTADALERVAEEFVEDLAGDGVIYGEVRWAPQVHTARGLTLHGAVDAVQQGLARGCASAAATGHPIRVEQLLTALRHQDNAEAIAALTLERYGYGVVGFDIAGPEAHHGLEPHREALKLLAEQCVPATVHAGEAAGVESIRSALVEGRAARIGHGVRLAEDITVSRRNGTIVDARLGEVAAWIRDRRIPLELSPTSNLQTGAISQWGDSLASHPFDVLYRLGFTVTVNVDNRTMSGTTLTNELHDLAETFGYETEDLVRFQRNAAQAAFLPLPERDALTARIDDYLIAKPSETLLHA